MDLRRQRGLSLIEAIVAVVVVVIGVFGILAMVPGVLNLSRTSRETQFATSALRSKLDEIRAVNFPSPQNPSGPDIYTMYNNATFTAVGLEPPAPGVAHGRVRFLTEAQAVSVFAIKMDLDLDLRSNETDAVAPDFTCFPTVVEVFWKSDNEVKGVTVTTVIYNTSH